jgi:hypothetical protein
MMRVLRDDDPAGVDLTAQVDTVFYFRDGLSRPWQRGASHDPLWACYDVAMALDRMSLGWPTIVAAHDAPAVDAWLAERGEQVTAYQAQQAQEVTV